MTSEWYYSRDGQQHGPFEAAALQKLAKTGELLPTDFLWKEGMADWRLASDFPKLFAPRQAGSQAGSAPATGDSQARPQGSPPEPAESTPGAVTGASSKGPSSGAPSSLKGLTMALGIEPAKPGEDSLLGCDIGGVRIIRLIAEGGMGRVYEGKQDKPNRTVAVKVMRPGLTSPSVLKRFEYEAEVLGRLQHPGIAHIYSVGVHRMGNATVPYFVMEYIADAKTLTKYARDLKLPVRQRLDLFRSVCEAVAHGHQKGVIHRDLKPSNILVDGSGQPKVIDFGVARATDSDMALTTMQTDVGQLIGTLQYMSPEQFRADPNDIDVRSDVYALGVILYELLAGKMPYDVKKKAIHEVARIVQEDDPTPLSSFNRALKGDVAVIAGKCLEKERGRRYSSASELGLDVGRYLTGEPISASPPGFIDGLIRLAKKHRVAATAVAGVFASLVLAVVGIALFAARAEKARKQAEASRVTAEQEREKADEQSRRALDALAAADAAEARTKQERDVALQRLYEANLYRLQQLIEDNQFSLCRRLFQETAALYEGKAMPIELACIRMQCEQALLVLGLGGNKEQLRWHALAFSPDGTRLATASHNMTAQIWDAATGKQLVVLQGHQGAVTEIAFSPDGNRLATGAFDKTARLWDAATGKLLMVFEGHTNAITDLAFSPDGDRLATGTHEKTARVWDAATGKQLVVFEGHTEGITDLAFSPDGDRLATGSHDKTARVWDAATGKQLVVLQGHTGWVSTIAFSPDGTRLATGGGDTTARIWDAVAGKQLALLKGDDSEISTLAFSPNGKRLATGAKGKSATARVWDVMTGKQVSVLQGHRYTISKVIFAPNGAQLVTGSWDGTARMWDTETGAELIVFAGNEGGIYTLAYSHDGSRLATVGNNTARIWDAKATRRLAALDGVEAAVFSPDGYRMLASSGSTASLWDCATVTPLATLKGHTAEIMALAYSPDGSLFATGSRDTTARIWDAATGNQLAVLAGGKGWIYPLVFSPDGTRLATSGETVQIWDVATGKQSAVLEGHVERGLGLTFSPDGMRVAFGCRDKTARVWDAATGKQLVVLQGHTDWVSTIAFSPDGTRLVTGSGTGNEHQARLWETATGKQLAVLEGHENGVSTVAFSPDGNMLATHGFSAHTPMLWDAKTGKRLTMLEGHSNYVASLAFSPDGERLATTSLDNTLRIWDARSGVPLAVFATAFVDHLRTSLARTPVFSPDGSRLAVGGAKDGALRLWGVSNADIYHARVDTLAIERRLDKRLTAWLKDGPDAAVAKLKEAKATLTPDEYRVAGNMILKRSAGGPPGAAHK